MPAKKYACLLWVLISVWPVLNSAQGAEPAAGIEAITKPSQDVKLGFVRPGVVAKLLVKEGQDVKEGQLLVQQNDFAEQAQLEQLKANAEDQTRVKAAKAQLEQKKVDLVKLEKALKKGASTDLEVEHARLDVVIAGFQLDVEKFQRGQDTLKQKELQLQIERMRINSPIEGRVEEILVREGEPSDALVKVIRVVNTKLLWVDVPVPMAQAQKLQVGAKMEVIFGAAQAGEQTKPGGEVVKGEVIFLAAVADGASGTRMVRVQAPNPTSRPAGEHVEVRIPDNTSAAVAGNQKTGPVAPTGPIPFK
jgi:RND family efflux transporter MFP subunit